MFKESKKAKEATGKAWQELFEEMKQGKSDRLKRYLKTSANFHNYSKNNKMLITLQKPNATKVNSGDRWKKMGYLIKKRETGIRIWAPRKKKIKTTQIVVDEETGEEKEEEVEKVVLNGFSLVPVFDYSQVRWVKDGPEPQLFFFDQLGDAFQDIYLNMKNNLGNVKELSLRKDEQGYTDGKVIVVNKDLDYNNKTLTLLHEWAHIELDHIKMLENRKRAELEAEATSYIVSSFLGLSNPFSSDYIQQHGNKVADLKDSMERIQKSAAKMIERIKKIKTSKATA